MTAVRFGPGGEFELIERLVDAGRALPPGVTVGPGDDCTVLDGGLVVSCDMMVEDVHFRREWLTPREIGFRAAAAALSDVAAMAAQPLAVLVAYALPRGDGRALAPELHDGVEEACRSVGAGVVGGDVTASPGPLVMDVTAMGMTERPVLRSGARPGDALWVTGHLGAAAAAVRVLMEGGRPADGLRGAFVRPRPRAAEASWLAERVELTALIDLSDGLTGDAAHIAAASEVTLEIDTGAVPVAAGVAEAVGSEDEALRVALSGGDDYELLLAAPADVVDGLAGAFRGTFGVPLTRIGRVVERGDARVSLRGPDGSVAPAEHGGWDHFGGADG